MNLTFIESSDFNREREEIFDGDDEFRALQNLLRANPTCGDVIPHSSGVRKVRFGSKKQGKGKRGGIRIAYMYMEDKLIILLMRAYVKNEKANLSDDEIKELRRLADAERDEQRGKP
jgi:mRNA-degrading endonuclease RelE of RelBE toxin-antitoxin system